MQKDFQLSPLRAANGRSSQLKTFDSDWERDTYLTGHDIESDVGHGNTGGHLRGRSLVDAFPSGSGLSPLPERSRPAHVTVTRTTTAVADDGAPYELPIEKEHRSKATEPESAKGLDWWDSSESTGSAVQSAAASRVGLYESRVGYRHDRIPDDFEESYGSPKSPASLGSLRARA